MNTIGQLVDAAIARNDANTRRAHMAQLRAKQGGRSRHWHYTGDVSIEHGGTFYHFDDFKYGYVNAWRVQPCSDAGGPDNEFWIEELTVIIDPHGSTQRRQCMACVGLTTAQLHEATRYQRRHMLFNAALSYGRYDQLRTTHIRIGKKAPYDQGWDDTTTPVQLPHNTSLYRLMRRTINANEFTR
jgi:hypothetical protein